MRPALPLLALLAACGGGSSTAPAPSADVAVSHPWLAGNWRGDYRSEGGLSQPMDITFRTVATPTGSEALCDSMWTLGADRSAPVQATGMRIVYVSTNFANDSQNTVTLKASANGATMEGTYVVRKLSTGDLRDRGALSLMKWINVSLEVYDAPGWVIVVREER